MPTVCFLTSSHFAKSSVPKAPLWWEPPTFSCSKFRLFQDSSTLIKYIWLKKMDLLHLCSTSHQETLAPSPSQAGTAENTKRHLEWTQHFAVSLATLLWTSLFPFFPNAARIKRPDVTQFRGVITFMSACILFCCAKRLQDRCQPQAYSVQQWTSESRSPHNQDGCEETKKAFWLGSTCYKPSANSLQNQLLFFPF